MRERIGRDEVAGPTRGASADGVIHQYRAGLPRLVDLDPITGERIRASETTAVATIAPGVGDARESGQNDA